MEPTPFQPMPRVPEPPAARSLAQQVLLLARPEVLALRCAQAGLVLLASTLGLHAFADLPLDLAWGAGLVAACVVVMVQLGAEIGDDFQAPFLRLVVAEPTTAWAVGGSYLLKAFLPLCVTISGSWMVALVVGHPSLAALGAGLGVGVILASTILVVAVATRSSSVGVGIALVLGIGALSSAYLVLLQAPTEEGTFRQIHVAYGATFAEAVGVAPDPWKLGAPGMIAVAAIPLACLAVCCVALLRNPLEKRPRLRAFLVGAVVAATFIPPLLLPLKVT